MYWGLGIEVGVGAHFSQFMCMLHVHVTYEIYTFGSNLHVRVVMKFTGKLKNVLQFPAKF